MACESLKRMWVSLNQFPVGPDLRSDGIQPLDGSLSISAIIQRSFLGDKYPSIHFLPVQGMEPVHCTADVYKQTTIHTKIHIYRQFRVTNSPKPQFACFWTAGGNQRTLHLNALTWELINGLSCCGIRTPTSINYIKYKILNTWSYFYKIIS